MLTISYWIFLGIIIGLLITGIFLFRLSIRIQREFMTEMERRFWNCCNDE